MIPGGEPRICKLPENVGDADLNKVERLRGGRLPQPDLHALLRQITESLRESRGEFPTHIASRLGDRLWFLDLDRVSHFYAEDKLTYAVSEGKAYSVDHAIVELERRLDPAQFVRIHRSTLVNLAWIKEVSSLPVIAPANSKRGQGTS